MHLFWKEGGVPQERDAKIVTLLKNNGDQSDCNNYRGMSLLRIVGKALLKLYSQEYIYWLSMCVQSHSASLDLECPLLS